MKFTLWFLSVWILQFSVANANTETLLLKDALKKSSVSEYASYYIDSQNALSLSDIIQLRDEQWLSPYPEENSFGFIDHFVWVKFKISNIGSIDRSFVLSVDYPLLDYIQLNLFLNGKLISQTKTGDTFHFSSRPAQVRNFVFPYSVKRGEELEIFLQVRSKGIVTVPVFIWDQTHYLESSQLMLSVDFLYYGIVLGMMAYYFLVYLSVRHISYLLFSLQALFSAIYLSTLRGDSFQYFWPDYPQLNNVATPASIAVWSLSIQLFTISLLTTLRTVFSSNNNQFVG